VLFTMDAATTAHHHPGYADAADQVVELGTDCDFAWAYLRADAPDAVGTYFTASTAVTPTPKDWTLAPSQGLTIAYVPFEEYIPAGATIVSARLGLVARNSWYVGDRDSLLVTSLETADVPAWWQSRGVGANPNRAHASWEHCIQGYAGSPHAQILMQLGYPASHVGSWPWMEEPFHLWDLGRSQMSRFRGDECDGHGYHDPDCGWASFLNGHDLEVEMRRVVQAMVNGGPNRGLVLANLCEGGGALQSFYHWDTDASGGTLGGQPRDYKPFWVVTYDDRAFEPYLPGGAEGAMVFTTDDGVANANRCFVQAYADAGLPPLFGLYLAEVHVGEWAGGLTFAGLAALRALGVEIGPHSRWHRNDPDCSRDGLTVHDPHDFGQVVEYWPGMPADALTPCASGWDSLLVDADPVWLYQGLEAATGVCYRDDPYVAKGMALPHQDFDLPVVRALHQHGYRYFRCGTATSAVTNAAEQAYRRRYILPTEERLYLPADTIRAYCPTNPEPMSAAGLPITVQLNELDQAADYLEAEIKTWARHRMEVLMAQDLAGGILSIYTHDVADGTGYYASGCIRPQWLTWILEEYLAMGSVWICRPRDLNDWIRQTRMPIDTPDTWQVHDLWRWSAADGALVAGGGVPVMVGVSAGDDVASRLPTAVRFGTAHPNPFNPQTRVVFDLPRGGPARLTVHDVQGRLLRTLCSGQRDAGRHSVTWDGRDDRGRSLASGVYVVRVASAFGADAVKVTLVR
jgi:hypothetical protein